MSRDPRLYLDDILQAGARIQSFTAGLNRGSFPQEDMAFDATLRNLEIIGEAVKRLPRELLEAKNIVPWREVAGFRDILAHAYFSVDPDVVWDIVEADLPILLVAVREIRVSLGQP